MTLWRKLFRGIPILLLVNRWLLPKVALLRAKHRLLYLFLAFRMVLILMSMVASTWSLTSFDFSTKSQLWRESPSPRFPLLTKRLLCYWVNTSWTITPVTFKGRYLDQERLVVNISMRVHKGFGYHALDYYAEAMGKLLTWRYVSPTHGTDCLCMSGKW